MLSRKMITRDHPALRDYVERVQRELVHPGRVPLPRADAPHIAAAVLIPILYRDDGLHIIYTRRSDRLKSHRGQVAFPGGRFDLRDSHLLAAALRETQEEVGIEPDQVEVLGSFEGRTTRAEQIFVTPFVGIVHGPVELRPDPKEVADIFEVPLVALHDRRYRGHYRWHNEGALTTHPAILYGGQTIWGLTYYLTLRFLHLTRLIEFNLI